MPNISRSKGNQTLKFGQVIEYKTEAFLYKNHAQNEADRLVPDLFLFFKKALYEVKASGLQHSFNHFRWSYQLCKYYVKSTKYVKF